LLLTIIMNYLITILMIIILYSNYIETEKIVLKLKRTDSNIIVLKLKKKDSNKIVLKLKRTDNYELIYNFQNQTTSYTKMILLY
jgi:hypothetical protein